MAGMCVLAPMVRTGELPTRLLALKYGADLRYRILIHAGPETVDMAIIGTRRVVNNKTNTIDFVKAKSAGKSEERIIFRTYPEKEAGKLIFQLGTASAKLAVEAAKVVAGDVAGIDVNSGCPKHFSIHAGMGAALLKAPEKLIEILTSLVTEVGVPSLLPISVKIRLLEPLTDTVNLVRRICTTGVSRVSVHCRTIPMRPRDTAIRDVLSDIAEVCHEAGIECFANGDVASRTHAEQLIKEYGVDGCMIARAAETNPSVFLPGDKLPWYDIAREFLRTSIEFDHHFPNTKFCLSHIVPGKSPLHLAISRCKTPQQACEVLGVPFEPLLVEDKTGKVSSGAVEKAKAFSETARAAGGGVSVKSGGKKTNERGVSVHGNEVAESELQKAVIAT